MRVEIFALKITPTGDGLSKENGTAKKTVL
jgi:hypothetical protein